MTEPDYIPDSEIPLSPRARWIHVTVYAAFLTVMIATNLLNFRYMVTLLPSGLLHGGPLFGLISLGAMVWIGWGFWIPFVHRRAELYAVHILFYVLAGIVLLLPALFFVNIPFAAL